VNSAIDEAYSNCSLNKCDSNRGQNHWRPQKIYSYI